MAGETPAPRATRLSRPLYFRGSIARREVFGAKPWRLPMPARGGVGPSPGFTLIELLVVISIIAVLAAMLFPVFARSREKARQAACTSNLKQIGIALQMYTDDYDGTYPRGQFWPFDGTQLWSVVVAPYVKNTDVFKCPSQGSDPYGYGYNIAYWGAGNPVNGMHGINDAVPVTEPQVPVPAETIWVVDFGPYWGCGLEFGIQDPTKRHNGGADTLFVDGHVKWLQDFPERLWTINDD